MKLNSAVFDFSFVLLTLFDRLWSFPPLWKIISYNIVKMEIINNTSVAVIIVLIKKNVKIPRSSSTMFSQILCNPFFCATITQHKNQPNNETSQQTDVFEPCAPLQWPPFEKKTAASEQQHRYTKRILSFQASLAILTLLRVVRWLLIF